MVTTNRTYSAYLVTTALVMLSVAASAEPAGGAAQKTEGANAIPRDGNVEAPTVPGDIAPHVSHAPIASAREGDALVVRAVITHGEAARRAVVVYRASSGGMREVPFLRTAGAAPYAAVIPADDVHGTEMAYAIEIETLEGIRVEAFASRMSMQRVVIVPDAADARERALLLRVGGKRSVSGAMVETVSFGSAPSSVRAASGAIASKEIRDGYNRVEASYTYRLLRDVAEFGIRFGVLRGTAVVPNETDPKKYSVGLNYGAPTVRFRLTDFVHAEAELLTSITEVGFSVGGGGALIVGDPYGTRLTVGGESIQRFGTRVFSRFDVGVGRGYTIAPTIEVTSMPHADRAGVRLTTELGIPLGESVALAVRGGYEARQSSGGGPSGGLGATYSF